MRDFKRKYILYIFVATIVVYGTIRYFDFAAGFISNIVKSLMPFAAGAVMAYNINILMVFYEKLIVKYFRNTKATRMISIILSFLTFLILIIFLLGIIVPQLAKIVSSLMNTNPNTIENIILDIEKNEWLSSILSNFKIDISNIDIANYITRVIQNVMSGVGNILTSVIAGVSGIFNTAISLFMAVVFAIYILFDKEKMLIQGDKLLRAFIPGYRERILYVLNIFNTSFKNYLISQVKEAFILGTLLYIVMLAARLPYGASISVLVGVTALVPVIGAYVGLIIGALMILTTSFQSMVVFIILHTVVQQFENNIIYPRVVGSSVGLPGVWVIVAVALGGALGGVTGVLVAVPVAASLYLILKAETERRL